MGTVVRSFVNGFVNGLVVSRFWQMERIDFGNENACVIGDGVNCRFLRIQL